MLEYVFFNQQPCNKFMERAANEGIEAIIHQQDESFIVNLPEDIDDDLQEALEQLYDELIDMDRDIEERKPDDSQGIIHTAGITVSLSDGRTVYANVSPELLSKVLQCIDTCELNILVDAIVRAVETPDASSLCQR